MLLKITQSCSIETYAYKFNSDGVEYDSIKEMFETIITQTEEMVTTSEITEKMKDDILARKGSVREVLEKVY